MVEEWSSRFNPYNSDKLFSQIYKWRQIKRGNKIPSPTLVSIDPANACDLNCEFCNADFLLKRNRKFLSRGTLGEIADYLRDWKTETVCIGGGGESLLNLHTSYFIDKCVDNEIEVGVVTNGTRIHKNLESLSKCTWVGISVDAGTKETYEKLKGKNKFGQVISNIEKLVKYSEEHDSTLANRIKSVGVGMKYLLYKSNINVNEIYLATKIAKDIGCTNIHIRPSAPPWDKLNDPNYTFSRRDLRKFRRGIKKARTLEDDSFRVYGITHKFDRKFRVNNDFDSCYAIFMNGVIMPPSENGKFDFGLCCDRRGDSLLTLRDLTSLDQIREFWGGEKHWKIFDKVDVNKCGKCTYRPHNQIYENVIQVNSMCYNFI